MRASDFFTLPESLASFAAHFPPDAPPWEWVKGIEKALASWKFDAKGARGDIPRGVYVEGPVYLHPSVRLPPYAVILGPVWLGPECQIRPGALIRNRVIAGARCVLGSACEYKNSLLLDDVETAHLNYVGDSVLGNRAHLGAGAVCANVRLDRGPVSIRAADRTHDTGLRKFGAIVGDGAEVGCNAVLNPGAILGRRSLVLPTVNFGGQLPESTIARAGARIFIAPRKDIPA